MQHRRILFSWIGHADLRAMGAGQPKATQKKLLDIVGPLSSTEESMGPVKTFLADEAFDEIHLLSDYPAWVNKAYAAWIGYKVSIHVTHVSDPTHHGEIFSVVDPTMKAVVEAAGSKPLDLGILLSPGTPAMAAVWVLLGKTKYPATFYQTYDGKSWASEIPFDLTVDYIPELLRGADTVLQHLAAQGPQDVEGFEQIIGTSRPLKLAVGRARKAALRDVPVLLLGESGTGKEMFARAIHAASHRKHEPFVAVNCAAIPRELLESELFGHVKGAFTGADRDRDGAFRQADGGILFLDEIGECDAAIQAKLLRVVQPIPGEGPCVREFQAVGASHVQRSDVRVIAATNRDLFQMMSDGHFREDMYYRLAVISIQLPPLRERKSDTPALASAILAQINRDFESQEPGYEHKELCTSANLFVKRFDWPGNIRQLQNVLLQAAVMSEGKNLTDRDLQAAVATMPVRVRSPDILDLPLDDGFDLEELLQKVQSHYLQRAMDEAGGVKSRAARLLGIRNYQTLDARLKRLGIAWKRR